MLSNLVKFPILFAAVGAMLGGSWILFHPGQQSAATPSLPVGGQRRPVLVELFTSEGCSSCPPADALLKRLSEQQPLEGVQLIALEEHVDYWNHLGWADPFSAPTFSERQDEYAHSFGTDSVYTPQMIVDGQFELVGSRSDEACKTIQKAAVNPKVEVSVMQSAKSTREKPILEVQVSNPHGVAVHGPADLWIALTEANLQSDVKAGENSGEVLKHAAVVRSLRKFETVRDASGYRANLPLTLDPKWKREDLSAVVFLSERDSHRVIGAGITALRSQ